MKSNIHVSFPYAAFNERDTDLIHAFEAVMNSGSYILGEAVNSFEKDYASFTGSSSCVGVANGTDAIEISLRALEIGANQAVFTVSHTAVATVAAIERAGAVPVLVDVDPQLYTMDLDSLVAAIEFVQSDTKLQPAAVIPVHLYGNACDMDGLAAIAQKYKLKVIEDCAQAHGTTYNGKHVGNFADAGAFSFYPTKNLGAFGDAGAVVTNDQLLAEKVKSLRQYGWEERYISKIPGINSRLDPIQAAMLGVQLQYLHEDIASRRAIAHTYGRELASTEIDLPVAAEHCEHSYHLYVIRCKERDALAGFLQSKNIGTGIHYPVPVHLQPAYAGRISTSPNGLPNTESLCAEILSLPMYPQLTDTEVERVCAAVKDFFTAGV